MIVAKVQKLGRIAIPRAYRQLYHIREGDLVEFVITKIKHADGSMTEFHNVKKEVIR